jgi:hypothetical protein
VNDHHPADGRALYGPVRAALTHALDALDTTPADLAAIALAERYAHEIDGGGDLAKLGPPLLAALTALGMTPAARKTLAKGGDSNARPVNPLDALAAKRAARGR